jgi:hypothetical protein
MASSCGIVTHVFHFWALEEYLRLRWTKPTTQLWIAVVLACAFACSRAPDAAVETEAPHIEHAERSQQLASLMRELGRLREERLSKAMEPHPERSQQIEAIAETARLIARSAGQIEFARPNDWPDSLDPSEFELRAELLRRLSLKLAERAATSPDRQLWELVEAVDATCGGCHARFR